MKVEDCPISFLSNHLWQIIVSETSRLSTDHNGEGTEDYLKLMATLLKIWKCRKGKRFVICSTDKQYALFIDGTRNGVIIRMIDESMVWEISLEDRKWVYGVQLIRLFDLMKKMEIKGIFLKIE